MSDSPITPSTRFESYMADISSNLENIAQKMTPEGTGGDDSGATELYKLEPATRFESYMSDISGKLEQIAQNVTPGGGGGGGGGTDGLPITGGTMSGSIDMDGNSITNLPQTSTSGDAVSYGQAGQMLTTAIDERKLGGSKTAAQVTDGTLNVAANVGMIYNLSEDLTLTDQTKSAFVPNGKTTYPVGSRLVVVEYDGTYRFDVFPGFLDLEKTAQNAEESYQKKQRVPIEFAYSLQSNCLIEGNSGNVIPYSAVAGYNVTSAVNVSGYNRIYVSACATYTNYYYAFYTSGGTFISGERSPNTSKGSYYSGEVTVPQNAATVRVACLLESGARLPEHVISHYEYVDVDIQTWENGENLSGTSQSNKYLNDSGVVASANGWKVLTVNVNPSDYLSVRTAAYDRSYYYIFQDQNNARISGLQPVAGTTGMTNLTTRVSVPEGAKKILVSGQSPNVQLISHVLKKKWSGKKWVVVGDSLTEVNARTTMHYHDYIAQSTGITVVNMGVSGSGYRRKNDTNQAFYQRIVNVQKDADVVTIFGSFNDGLTDLGTADDTGTTTVGGCVNETIDALYSVMPTVQLGIVSPTPWQSSNPYDGTSANAYADLLEAICKKRSIPFLNLYYESNLRPWDSSFRSLAYSKDDGNGVHPDETGHKIIAPRFEAFLDSLLQSSS